MADEKMEEKKPAQAATVSSGGSDSKLWAALCWVFAPIIGIVVLVTDKKSDKFVLFHAYQSIAAAIGLWVVAVVVSVVTFGIGFLCWPVVWLGMLYFGYKAYQGEKFMLPVVGEFAEKQMSK